MWQVVDTGVGSAAENMAIDAQLLKNLNPNAAPILHLYDWEGDCATYGKFIDPQKFLNLSGCARRGLSLAQRPTGGGIILHFCDLAFSVLVPSGHPSFSLNTLENYAFVNRLVIEALKPFLAQGEVALLPQEPVPLDSASRHFCMAKPTQYDVMVGQRKVGGAAQRRTKQGYLHQGSIALMLPPQEYLKEILLPETRVLEAMQLNTFALLPGEWSKVVWLEARRELKNRLCRVLLN